MDLKLQTLVDYQPMTQDQLISALEQYAGELAHRVTMLETNRCLDELERSCIAMENAIIVYNYINKYGVTHHACELLADGDMVAMEGVVDSVKEAIVKFVRWLYEMITKICKSIIDLFSDNDDSTTLLSDDSSKIDDLLDGVDPKATTDKKLKKPNFKWLNKSIKLFLTNIGGDDFVALLDELSKGSPTVDAGNKTPVELVEEIRSYYQTFKWIKPVIRRLIRVGKLKQPTKGNEKEALDYLVSVIKELYSANPKISSLANPDNHEELIKFHKHIARSLQIIVQYQQIYAACKDIYNEVRKLKKQGNQDKGKGSKKANTTGKRNKK